MLGCFEAHGGVGPCNGSGSRSESIQMRSSLDLEGRISVLNHTLSTNEDVHNAL